MPFFPVVTTCIALFYITIALPYIAIALPYIAIAMPVPSVFLRRVSELQTEALLKKLRTANKLWGPAAPSEALMTGGAE